MMVRTALLLLILVVSPARAQQQKLLLLAQGPDGHPRTTHEYVAGQKILAKLLRDVPELKITIVKADGDWPEGPGIIDEADHCVLFVSEGAKWVNADPARREAFQRLAKRKGGLAVLHWGMGTREATNIDPFVQLFGACHGGPDRKHKVVETTCQPAANHPATVGMKEFKLKEEFYYALKRDPNNKSLTPLLTAKIDDHDEMVAWAWEREDGGRSFGFSGLHYHANWQVANYQRLVAQGVLWTTKLAPPQEFPSTLTKADFELPESPAK
jgi:type 1 glutamine amidotransferase